MDPVQAGDGATLVSLKIGPTTVSVMTGDDDAMFLQWGKVPATPPFTDDQVSGVYAPEKQAVLAGRLPPRATAVEVVAPDGIRVHGTIGSGAWIAVVADNRRGIEAYPVLFRDSGGGVVKRSIPADFERRAASREDQCPACESFEWELVTAPWEDVGGLRSTRLGHHGDNPGHAYVCAVCGHAEPLAMRYQYE